MITKDQVVSLQYTLRDDAGNVLDASNGNALVYLHGHNNIIPGLEKELNGMKAGDKKKVTVGPDDAYGQYDPELKFALPREQFADQAPQAGMMVQLQSQQGQIIARIENVDDKQVQLDANHPLAGQTLHFEVEVAEIREATSEELSHGHPHGPGGHHH